MFFKPKQCTMIHVCYNLNFTKIYRYIIILFQKYLLPLKSAESSVHIEPSVVDDIFYQVITNYYSYPALSKTY